MWFIPLKLDYMQIVNKFELKYIYHVHTVELIEIDCSDNITTA